MENKDLLNGYRQHPPFMIEIEPVEGCNYHSIRAGLLPDPSGKDKEIMPRKLTKEVIDVFNANYFKEGSTTIVKRKWEK